MNVHSNIEMNRGIPSLTQPPPSVSVESQTQEIYDAMMELGTEIDMLESVLLSVLHDRHPEESSPVSGVPASMPEAVKKLNGLLAGAYGHRKRLESIRLRLALQ